MDRISFSVNGIKCHVGCEVSSDVTLLDYLREYLELRGTKYMCREGGCGACIVSAIKTPGDKPVSVNACLVSITSCFDWDITTIEKVGNKKDGYSPIQKTLAEYNGSQCGYCTPGWVMAMYSLLQSKKNMTQLEIEQSFGSNICRCTGYRPILDAFKKFASDAPKPIKMPDIEDLQICKKTGENCDKSKCDESDWCFVTDVDYRNILEIDLKDGKHWFRVSTVRDIFDILRSKGDNSYMLVAGNTAKGAYPIDEYPDILIDISGVRELKGWTVDQNLLIGGGTTLTELLEIFEKLGKEEYFHYLKAFYDHIQLVAHIPVRNLGTIAGNLMIKHQHNEFTSDIFLLLETVGAEITVRHYKGFAHTISMQQFLRLDMRGRVILNVSLPPLLDSEYKIVTYKIMPRVQNVHAIINAGFIYRLKSDGTVRQSRIVYSGLVPPSTRASITEKFIFGKKLFTNETLQGAVKILKQELIATPNPPEASPEYRKRLALGLFYKSILTLCPSDKLNTRYRSGATKIHATRPVSDGRQIFDTNPTMWPLTQPVQKVEALIQCSGEAPYTDDLPAYPHEVFAAFVLTTEGSGNITNIDASQALGLPGVVAFYTAKDIPGLNSFTPNDQLLYSANEEVLCNGVVHYFNQPLGIIVAETRQIAERAAKLVHVSYKNVKRPIIDINEARKDPSRLTQFFASEATERGSDVFQVIKGENTIHHQYHFSMETLVCVTKPSEQGLEVHCATQWMDGTQIMVGRAMKMDLNSVDVYVQRLGGAYGVKISRTTQLAVASSLVARTLNRPCRMIQALTTNMRAVGKRMPCTTEFEVGIDKSGAIQYVDYKLFEDNGYIVSEGLSLLGIDVRYNAYRNSRWKFTGTNVVTDTHSNTWCRAPGTLESIAMAEHIMEQISYEASLDPAEVRLANLDMERFNEVKDMYETLKANSNYETRKAAVAKFNSENRWKKRGLRVTFMRWSPVGQPRFDANLSVYHADGTVAITHSGIEMGQGINTKAVQVAAYFLKIPLDKIKIKGNNTIVGPNAFITGGSIASQNVALVVQRCCEQLLARLEPIKAKMPTASWEELIKSAYEADVDLQIHGFVGAADIQVYNVCGVCFAEVEVDILTGEHEILRVDLIEDPGRSLSPEIDVGQIEGAFIMGVGYWTTENIIFNPATGEILTDRTWNYHVPQARDIPQDFRVYLTKKYPSSDKILGTKAVGEPPLCLSVAIPFAIREAIVSARLESGIAANKWFRIDGPSSLDKILMAASTSTDNFKLY